MRVVAVSDPSWRSDGLELAGLMRSRLRYVPPCGSVGSLGGPAVRMWMAAVRCPLYCCFCDMRVWAYLCWVLGCNCGVQLLCFFNLCLILSTFLVEAGCFCRVFLGWSTVEVVVGCTRVFPGGRVRRSTSPVVALFWGFSL